MATDWIKMRVNLRKNPKVVALSRHLCSDRQFINAWADPVQKSVRENVTEIVTFENVTRVTVCALLELWGAMNGVLSDEGTAPYMELDDIDEVVGLPGFGEAMLAVGWVKVNGDNGLIFPNFTEFNTPEKERPVAKSGAERAKEYRLRRAGLRVTKRNENVTDRHGDKRREEKSKEPPLPPEETKPHGIEFQGLPPELDTKAFREAWMLWEQYQRESGKGVIQPITRVQNFADLAAMGSEKAVKAIRLALGKGWKTLVIDAEELSKPPKPEFKPITEEEYAARREEELKKHPPITAEERERIKAEMEAKRRIPA